MQKAARDAPATAMKDWIPEKQEKNEGVTETLMRKQGDLFQKIEDPWFWCKRCCQPGARFAMVRLSAARRQREA